MRRIVRLVAAGAVLACGPARGDDREAAEFFEREVRPVLVERCQGCHGGEKLRGGLDLRDRAAILAGGDSGPAAEPGDPAASLIVEAVRYEGALRMPPEGKLDDRAIAALALWVGRGLPWPDDAPPPAAVAPAAEDPPPWWLEPVQDPAPPEPVDRAWPRGPIDAFIRAGLEADGLAPAAEADRRTLARRLTFDLTGLPPTPEEVEAFLDDARPDAYERLVDRLLASPSFGERQGRHWLDLVRYADSRDARGIGSDTDIFEAWHYRDWVVDAFNRDLSYDRFVVDQVAGDLVPGAGPDGFNPEGLVATGMLCIGEWGTGDADKEKMLTDIVDDQVDVVGRVLLGLTMACARCHDHKFDPIGQRDYYALAGMFFSTRILPDPGPKTGGSPMLRTPLASPSRLAEDARENERALSLQTLLREGRAAAEARFAAREVGRATDYLRAAAELARLARESEPPAPAEFARSRRLDPGAFEGWIGLLGLDAGGVPLATPIENVLGAAGVHARRGSGDTPSATINPTGAEARLLTFRLPARSVSLHPGPTSAVAASWTAAEAGRFRVACAAEDSDGACGDGFAWELQHRRGPATTRLAGGPAPNGGRGGTEAPAEVDLRPGDSIRLVVAPGPSHICDTTAVTLRVEPLDGGPPHDLAADVLADPAAFLRSAALGPWTFLELPTPDAGRPAEVSERLAAWDRALLDGDPATSNGEAEALAAEVGRPDSPLRAFALSPAGPFLARQGARVEHLEAPERERLAGLRAEIDRIRARPAEPVPLVLAAREGGVPNSPHAGFRDARVHIRGSYLRLGEEVPRGVPAIFERPALEPFDGTKESGRLALARWIAHPEHPLTARVMANRVWQHLLGSGLVRTPANFGRLGEPPTDPVLLDHLAARLVGSGWSPKDLHRAILLSATYRQDSRATAEARERDPENRRFGRAPRRRLESEALRDALLAASGRLERTMGGPAYREFEAPRRTLYHLTIRSDRSSFGPLFDAADAAAIVDTRTESTVAPQALFLQNHPFVVTRAADLAAEARRAEVDDPGAGVDLLYRRLFARAPTEAERAVAAELLAAEPDAERAWMAYCQMLLLTNEFAYVD